MCVHVCMLSRFSPVRLFLKPMDRSPPGFSVRGILQARILEQVAISSSRESSQPRDQIHISYVSCIGRQVLYHQCHLGSLYKYICVYLHIQICICIYIYIYTYILSNTFSQTSLRSINSLFLPFKYVSFVWYFLPLVCWLELPIL